MGLWVRDKYQQWYDGGKQSIRLDDKRDVSYLLHKLIFIKVICCTHWHKKQMFGDFQDVFRGVTLMANSFNLRRGGLSMCPGDTVLWRAADESRPNAHRLALLYREKQASKLQKRELLYLCIALSSGGVLLWVQEELSVRLLLISLFRMMICFSSLSILVIFKRFSA